MSIELYPRSITTERALFCRCGGAGVFYPHEARIQAIQTEDDERYFAEMSTAEGEEDWVLCANCGRIVELKIGRAHV